MYHYSPGTLQIMGLILRMYYSDDAKVINIIIFCDQCVIWVCGIVITTLLIQEDIGCASKMFSYRASRETNYRFIRTLYTFCKQKKPIYLNTNFPNHVLKQ